MSANKRWRWSSRSPTRRPRGPVDVRIDVVDPGALTEPRTKTIGRIVRDGRPYDVVGTYLGVVADEN